MFAPVDTTPVIEDASYTGWPSSWFGMPMPRFAQNAEPPAVSNLRVRLKIFLLPTHVACAASRARSASETL
jgi:hypothetical protein